MSVTITNFGQVNSHLWRGAQPTVEQFSELAELGVKIVIDLREDIAREEEKEACKQAGLIHVSMPVVGVLPPCDAQLWQIFAIIDPRTVSDSLYDLLKNGNPAPTFVHCAHGEDRTSAVIAAYRMVIDGWSNADAFAESLKYHINPMQIVIREWIEHFNAAKFRKKFNLPSPSVS